MSFLFPRSGSCFRPLPGLQSCGDAPVVACEEGVQLFAVIDALGHGPDAEESATLAAAILRGHPSRPLAQLFSEVDEGLRSHRGVVLSVIRWTATGSSFAGVGNVDIFGPPGSVRPVAMAGTLGGGRYRFREFPLKTSAGQRWVLASDGLFARRIPEALNTLKSLPAQQAAEQLVAAHSRSHDDACALVIDFENAR